MSITKNRAKTLQEKFGFKDDDLKTPAHDAIMLWLDSNFKKIAIEYIEKNNFEYSWNIEEIIRLEKLAKNGIPKIKQNLEIKKSRLEREIGFYDRPFTAPGLTSRMESPQKQIFLDELKNIEHEIEELESWKNLGQLPDKSITTKRKTWERPIKSHNEFVIGFIDMEVVCDVPEYLDYSGDFPVWKIRHIEYSLMFEVKTSIKSIGEVVRQIQLYKNYRNRYKDKFIIVSPDDRYVDLLKSQNIGFVKCDCELPKAEIPSQSDLFGA